MGAIIPDDALENLKLYKYSGVDRSILSNLFLNVYWTKFAKLFPRNVAPNTITLAGLVMVILNVGTLIYYDPLYLGEHGGASGPPRWLYFTWAAGLFLYQTFDACDGKQARRTGMAGPLGEMFDHGCDAINTTLEVILCFRALDLTRSWWTVASVVATAANFYLTTWEEFHTGTLYLGVFSGPVEGIIIICIIYIVTGICGTAFWAKPVLSLPLLSKLTKVALLVKIMPPPVRTIPIRMAFMVFCGFGLGFNILGGYANVFRSLKKNDSALAPLARLMPFCLSVFLHLSLLSSPLAGNSYKTLVQSPLFLPYMFFWGLGFAHQVGRMITAHVTHTPFPYWDPMWLWIALGAIDGHALKLFGRRPFIQSTQARQTIFITVSLFISFILYGRFCTLVIKDITEYLGIACFTVRKRNKNGEWTYSGDTEKNA